MTPNQESSFGTKKDSGGRRSPITIRLRQHQAEGRARQDGVRHANPDKKKGAFSREAPFCLHNDSVVVMDFDFHLKSIFDLQLKFHEVV